MSLETSEIIRSLQRKLYRKAKAEPAFRFYVLYDKICREDILRHAFTLARGNAGAPGVDGVTFKQIEASGVEAWLAGLREDLVSKEAESLIDSLDNEPSTRPVPGVSVDTITGTPQRPLSLVTPTHSKS